MNDVNAKFNTLREDLSFAAKLAADLHQNCLASVLYNQLAALNFATSSKGNVNDALAMFKEMAEACCKVTGKYIKEVYP